MSADRDEQLKKLHEKVFMEGQKTAAQEAAAAHLADRVEVMAKASQMATDAFDLANQLAADGDPHKKRVVEILKDSVLRSLQAMDEVSSGDLTSVERRAAVKEAAPFSVESRPSETPSLNGPPSSSDTKALTHEPPAGEVRRKRGRPPGSKTRPKDKPPE